MKYLRILTEMASSLWAIEPDKFATIAAFMAQQARGEKLDASEIEAKIGGAKERAVAQQAGSVAIIPVRGVIASRMSMLGDISGGTSAEALDTMIAQALADEAIKAIVLDVDSPGGASALIDELAAQIIAGRGGKPIIAQVNPRSASAAYWISSAADEIVVTPSGAVGSIGVFAVHEDLSKALEMQGITPTLISAGKYKAETIDILPLSDEARAYVQADVDAAYAMFTARVAEGRGRSAAEVRGGFGEGRMVGAREAVKLGMADRVGTMAETLARLGVARAPIQQRGPGARQFAPARQSRALDLLD